MIELQMKRVQDCSEWLQLSAEDYTAKQSVGWLIDQAGMLCKSLAFVNNQMAIAKKILNERKVKAYNDLLLSSVSQEVYFAPSLAKDYIASKCSNDQYNYDLCERTSRTITHTVDVIRSCISALKVEMQYMNE